MRRRARQAVVVATMTAALLGTITAVPATAATPGLVRTGAGWLRGTVDDQVRSYQAIPYAAPPVGELRWRAPQPVPGWAGVRDATEPGSSCPQPDPFQPGAVWGDEDCLFVNVTTPARPARPRPVLVWLHGGSFTGGAGADYDPRRLAADGGIVVVTVNYRLGVLGYLGLPGLAGSGTFGLQDQQAALRWVRRNAAAFGGDPHDVTVAGQSAGGMSVCSQLTSPSSAGLFDRAIIQSGSCLTSWPDKLFGFGLPAGSPWSPLAQVQQAGEEAAAALDAGRPGPERCAPGTAPVTCLRGMTPQTLLTATVGDQGTVNSMFDTLAYGTPTLPLLPAEALRRGAFHRVPVLSGSTRDEHRSFLAFSPPIDALAYRQLLDAAFGAPAGRVADRYPVTDFDSPTAAWAAVATDRIWACPTLAGDRLLARHTPVYGYEFTDRDAPPPAPWITEPLGAYHGSELPYLFDMAYRSLGDGHRQLAADMIDSWAAFAATGRPAAPGAAPWPRFRSATAEVRTLAPGSGGQRTDFGAEHHCDLWADLATG